MWGVVLIFIAVANCNAKQCSPQPSDLPVTASGDHRIIGGSNTTIEKYPYIVQVKIAHKKQESLHCGGTLVTTMHVLTAGHCFFYGNISFERRPNKCKIREGATYFNKGGTVHQVTAIRVHEYYDIETFNFDLAIVLMTTPVDYSVSVARAVILPDDRDEVPDGAEVIAVGWGKTSVTANKLSTVLQEVELQKFPFYICRNRYERLYDSVVTEIMMCAGIDFSGKGVCLGDSGGPLIYQGIVVGVTSWGYSCAAPLAPGVYIDAIKMHYWIRETCILLSLMDSDRDDPTKVLTNGTNPGVTNPGSTGSLSSKIGLATVLASILYYKRIVLML